MLHQRFRREYYNYEKQPPSDHAENLRRYLRLAPSLVPEDDSLSAFCIRHPDLTDSNLKVSIDSSGLQILSVLDWQHAAILPLFLHAGMPDVIQNEEDEVSRRMAEPKLPDDFDKLSGEKQEWEKELLRRRLVHYHYNLSTAKHNRIHHKSLVYPLNTFRRRIFNRPKCMHDQCPLSGSQKAVEIHIMDRHLIYPPTPNKRGIANRSLIRRSKGTYILSITGLLPPQRVLTYLILEIPLPSREQT